MLLPDALVWRSSLLFGKISYPRLKQKARTRRPSGLWSSSFQAWSSSTPGTRHPTSGNLVDRISAKIASRRLPNGRSPPAAGASARILCKSNADPRGAPAA
jgi:hypothetical protein